MKKVMNPTGHVLVVHGPNLNLLGAREPEVYGYETLSEINGKLTTLAQKAGVTLAHFQSNAESHLLERIHQAIAERTDFIVINPAAYTHTSIALRDALAASRIPFVEVHLSNIYAREPFRAKSYFSDLARGVVTGLGAQGYELALKYVLAEIWKKSSGSNTFQV